MSKLINAGLFKMFKSKIFYFCTIAMAVFGVCNPIFRYIDMATGNLEQRAKLESIFFAYAVVIAIIAAVFTSLFIGAEYSDGTIRNKIIVGHTRSSIYLSNLIVAYIGVLIMQIAYLVPALLVGVNLFDVGMKVSAIVLQILVIALMTLALTAIFVLFSMTCSNKAITAIICIILTFGMMFVGLYINTILCEPEKNESFSYVDENGIKNTVPESKNPYYISGTKRTVYKALDAVNPGGQIIQLSSECRDISAKMPLSSVGVAVAISAIGAIIFKKKDIK